ncbi:hypothetical protein [Paraburkholderia sp. J94]|uniref:hypothetical protein n=1 Tax=Paraburkholderia sp. J94 TaxID=2805441 RepID=UPI002AB0C8EA|nr:hypothetical protein [Paraburkholderia sp. J94]
MTKSMLSRKHLTLVVTEDADERAQSSVGQGVQLTLPFNDGSAIVLTREADLRAPGAFEDFLVRYRPKWLLDVRIAPRMDFIAPSRAMALRHLSMSNIGYVDVLGHVDDPLQWLPFVEQLLESPECVEGPYAIVFDSEQRLRDARQRLPSLFHQSESSEIVSISTFGRNLIAL